MPAPQTLGSKHSSIKIILVNSRLDSAMCILLFFKKYNEKTLSRTRNPSVFNFKQQGVDAVGAVAQNTGWWVQEDSGERVSKRRGMRGAGGLFLAAGRRQTRGTLSWMTPNGQHFAVFVCCNRLLIDIMRMKERNCECQG